MRLTAEQLEGRCVPRPVPPAYFGLREEVARFVEGFAAVGRVTDMVEVGAAHKLGKSSTAAASHPSHVSALPTGKASSLQVWLLLLCATESMIMTMSCLLAYAGTVCWQCLSGLASRHLAAERQRMGGTPGPAVHGIPRYTTACTGGSSTFQACNISVIMKLPWDGGQCCAHCGCAMRMCFWVLLSPPNISCAMLRKLASLPAMFWQETYSSCD
jgi:hypothetical protein